MYCFWKRKAIIYMKFYCIALPNKNVIERNQEEKIAEFSTNIPLLTELNFKTKKYVIASIFTG